MAAKDYIWDSQAAQAIKEQELDKHHKKNETHYGGLAKEIWDNLKKIHPTPEYLKHGDLWDSLYPIIIRDSVTLKAFDDKKLPEPNGRGGARWYAWFTHYVTETYLANQSTEANLQEGAT